MGSRHKTYKCCVGDCSATSENQTLFCFPKNDNLRKLWLDFLVPTNPSLIGLSKEQLLLKRVCKQHFDKTQFDQMGKRIRYSYPSLFSTAEIELGEPLTTERNALSDHNYFKEQADDDDDDSDSTVFVGRADDPTFHEHSYLRMQEITPPEPNIRRDLVHPVNLSPAALVIKDIEMLSSPVSKDIVQPSPSTFQTKDIEMLSSPVTKDIVQPSTSTFQTRDIEMLSSPVSKDIVQPSTSTFQTKDIEILSSPVSKDIVQPSTSTFQTKDISDEVPSRPPIERKKVSVVRAVSSKKRKILKKVLAISKDSLGDSGSERLNQANILSQDKTFLDNFSSLDKKAKSFILMQLRLVRKNKMARRFTLDEKLLALMILKQSPKCYKLLESMFALPNKRTLNRLSEKICFEPGINSKVFNYISKNTKSWTEQKKLCTIVFDEVALTPHLTFNENKDIIEGFVCTEERSLKYCDHALVFMLRGICSSWRQCVAYYFCEGTVPALELKSILKKIISQVVQSGLIPLGTVCDQGSTFRTAIRSLREDTVRMRNIENVSDDGSINIDGHNLFTFYDPPHLLKGLRNNFIDKDLLWQGKIATWRDILYIYDLDSKLGHTRALPKLTEYHVDSKKLKKMKVSVAAQALSARTAAMLKFTDGVVKQCGSKAEESTMATTAEVVEFIDNLFDSVNGYPGGAKRGKMRKAVKKNSTHVEFWHNAIQKLKNIKFVDKTSKFAVKAGKERHVKVPSLEGWIKTLESFIGITKLLFSKYGVEFYYPRYINQDPLENFFGRIRAINYRNVNPDPHTFKCSFKSLVLSNILQTHSKSSNCEKDDGETLIDMNYLFNNSSKEDIENKKPNIKVPPSSSSSQSLAAPVNLREEAQLEKIKVQCSAYTAGYICRRISFAVNCKACTKTLTSVDKNKIHNYISHREFKYLKNDNLAYPNETFIRTYRIAAEKIHEYLNSNCHLFNVGTNLRTNLNTLNYSSFGCNFTDHQKIIKKTFVTIVTRLQVHNWCNTINKILNGAVHEKYVLKMSGPQNLALKKYKTFKLRKKTLSK